MVECNVLLWLACLVVTTSAVPEPLPEPGLPVPTLPIKLSSTFPRVQVPMTNRTAVLVTEGAKANYPLYYFAPSITKDGRYLIYQRYDFNHTFGPFHPDANHTGWYQANNYDAILGLNYLKNISGQLVRAGVVATAQACQQLCEQHDQCSIYVHRQGSGNMCYLRLDDVWGADATLQPEEGVVSGCLYATPNCGYNPALATRTNPSVQLWRVDLSTAQHTQLTHAQGVNTSWVPWQQEANLSGVMDYRSALNIERNFVVYFVNRQCFKLDLDTLQATLLFELSVGRDCIAQNSITPDGNFLLYIDAQAGATYKNPNVTGTKMVAYEFDTGVHHVFAVIDHASHHILPYDNRYVIVNHPPPGNHMGMVWADINNRNCTNATSNCGWTEVYGTPNPPYDRGDPNNTANSCHQVSTPTGIWFESTDLATNVQYSGMYDPFQRRRFQFRLPTAFGYSHTGLDPAGHIAFWETVSPKYGHSLWYLESVNASGGIVKPLVGAWDNSAALQRGHFHPQLTYDRQWLLMTALTAMDVPRLHS
eukprot:m.88177 g.88177  ORF g.88177 m.88177 type:complete len:534 (-) comp14813_c0_seq1:251-1852(-)